VRRFVVTMSVVFRPTLFGLTTRCGISPEPEAPEVAGAIFQRTVSPRLTSLMISPASNSMSQTCRGAHTTVGWE
jgi:hypothetical protein